MNLVGTVASIVTPVFLLAAIGFAWVRLGFDYPLQFVTRLAMTLALPCLLFVALMRAQAEPGALAQVALAAIAAQVSIIVVASILLKLGRYEPRTYLSPLVFGNTGNLGLPLALFAFGQEGLEIAVVVFAISIFFMFSLGIRFVAGRGAIRRILREPLIWATLLGGVFLWQGWETPPVLTRTLDLIGQMAIPLMLITLGVAVARLSASNLTGALGLSVIKLVTCAAIAWGIGRAFGLTDTAFGVLVLQMATPVAVTAYLLAARYEADAETVAGLVVASTLLAVPGLSLLLALLL